MKKVEIRIAGFGGQGVVLLGNIMGKAASIYHKKFAALTQSYGPESRGGSCRAELIINETPIDYPYIADPGIQVILSQEAYAEFGRKSPKDTLLFVDSELVKIDDPPAARLITIPASRLAQEMGRPVVANIIMLGFLAAHSNILPREALEKSIKDFIPAGTESFNMKAFELGYNYSPPADRPA
ncbi:MAG: 2-oxoacid:acceptor oxidoreductase family protein [Dehalococcoidia bacterium]|jgi:2-oxoglutarate ferredoxin oxidoreductase subunit gamma|nr:2-oxoacid:acceptor oxidoreductase family protein [Dehalococcoidia bacterium]MDD5495462.1 2-oxoacid:acceptor oxidoreductase family protein [Dehalococcoidia bacterium]